MAKFGGPGLERLERMLEEKVPLAFGACFAPKSTSIDENTRPNPIERESEAFTKLEADIKNRFTLAVSQQKLDFLAREDEALLTELNLMECDSCSVESVAAIESEEINADDSFCDADSMGNLNSIGEETLLNIENRGGQKVNDQSCATRSGQVLSRNDNVNNGCESRPSKVPHLPGSYKQSVKSKFDYYRKHHTFGKPKTSALGTPGVSSTHDCTTSTRKPNLTTLATTLPVGSAQTVLKTPASRRNELARIILKRRQLQTPTHPRPAVDP